MQSNSYVYSLYGRMNENSVDFLLKNKFSTLPLNIKKIIKEKGRLKPQISKLNGPSQNHNRTFNIAWYERKTWLTACDERKKLFCFPCLLFSSDKGPWNNNGYGDLKNLTNAFRFHENSSRHIMACEHLALFDTVHIDQVLNESVRIRNEDHNKKVDLNRDILKRLIDCIIFIAKQEIGFRGHDESKTSTNQGNYRELLKLLAKTILEILCLKIDWKV